MGVPLHAAMAALHARNSGHRNAADYGWSDILMERVGLSRAEYRLLTDGSVTLKQTYGFMGPEAVPAAAHPPAKPPSSGLSHLPTQIVQITAKPNSLPAAPHASATTANPSPSPAASEVPTVAANPNPSPGGSLVKEMLAAPKPSSAASDAPAVTANPVPAHSAPEASARLVSSHLSNEPQLRLNLGQDGDTAAELANFQFYCRRVGLSYEEMAAIMRTRFINPSTAGGPRSTRQSPFSKCFTTASAITRS
jgi:hypothetical protein